MAREFRRRINPNNEKGYKGYLKKVGPGKFEAAIDRDPYQKLRWGKSRIVKTKGSIQKVATDLYEAVPTSKSLPGNLAPSPEDKKKCGREAIMELRKYNLIDDQDAAIAIKHLIDKKIIY